MTAMTQEEKETYLADLHVGVLAINERAQHCASNIYMICLALASMAAEPELSQPRERTCVF